MLFADEGHASDGSSDGEESELEEELGEGDGGVAADEEQQGAQEGEAGPSRPKKLKPIKLTGPDVCHVSALGSRSRRCKLEVRGQQRRAEPAEPTPTARLLPSPPVCP